MYIALEGIDTSGKSTQIDALKRIYKDAIFTKEPGASTIGATIRDMVLYQEVKSSVAEMFLFLADRAEHIEDIIKPNLDKLIISDRSLVSGMAYAKNIDNQSLALINKIAVDDIMPHKVILLLLNEDELIKRLSKKSSDNVELRGVEYLLEIQDRLQKAVQIFGLEYIKIDASKPQNEITNIIKGIIDD
jgi:dTMP kinase